MKQNLTSCDFTGKRHQSRKEHFKHVIVTAATLLLQYDWETRTRSLPTLSQSFHLSEKPCLPVNLLHNISGCGRAAEATTSTEPPSGTLLRGSNCLATGGTISAMTLQADADTVTKLNKLGPLPQHTFSIEQKL